MLDRVGEHAVDERAHVRVRQAVIDVLAGAPTGDDPLRAEEAELLRDRREAHAGGVGKLRHAPLAHGEAVEEAEPRDVSRGSEERSGALERVVVEGGPRGVSPVRVLARTAGGIR